MGGSARTFKAFGWDYSGVMTNPYLQEEPAYRSGCYEREGPQRPSDKRRIEGVPLWIYVLSKYLPARKDEARP